MARKLFSSRTAGSGRDGNVCGLTGSMSTTNARLKELADKRGVGIIRGLQKIDITPALEAALLDPQITEAKVRAAMKPMEIPEDPNQKYPNGVVYFNHDISFKALVDTYCGLNPYHQIFFVYEG